MINLNEITSPTEMELVISFFDLTQYARFVKTLTPTEGFKFVSEYYEFAGDILERDGGIIVKFIGDAGLIAYPSDSADQAVLHLNELKNKGDEWLRIYGSNCRHIIKAHVGSVMCGQVGTKRVKRFDTFVETVNTAALLKSNGFAITPQLFRKLNSGTRKVFKKHTPPVTYIPIEERHRD